MTGCTAGLSIEEERFATLSLRRDGRLSEQQNNPEHKMQRSFWAPPYYKPDNQIL
jgi:hypothetical protein